MIEDKELGLKVAENPVEALWTNVKREAEMLIRQSENHLIIQNAMKILAEEKLKDFGK